jgi:pimeloyl-ACP methyl ester carboxylesterase
MYRMPEYVADLTALLARLKIDRLAFIGTSLGGVLARLYTTAHPERVGKLVLNDAAIGGNIAGTCRVAKRPSTAPKEFADWNDAISWFRAGHDGLSRLDDATLRTWIGHYLAPDTQNGLRFRCDPAVIERASKAADELASERGTRSAEARRKVDWELAQRLVMPVLLLRGSLSDVILRETADHFVSAVPIARCVDIPGSGHSPTLHEPEAQAALLEFFGVASDVLSHSAVAQ